MKDRERSGSTGLKVLLKTVELYMASCRLVLEGHPESIDMIRQNQQAIGALWHSALLYTLYHFRKNRAAIMVSASADGEWVARALKIWGQHPVRGSRLKGGVAAIRDMTRLLKTTNLSAGIVADGATGPAYIAQKGPVILARDTGFPIIPTGFAARPALYFRSWDRMVMPFPFSKIAMIYGPPIYVPPRSRGRELENFRQLLEKELNKATIKARRLIKSRGPR